MKKLLLGILLVAIFVVCNTVWAVTEERQIIDTTLDDSPTSANGTFYTGNYQRVACAIVYNETQVGNSVSVDITIDVSRDGSTWLDAKFYDVAGETTLQTTETLSADGSYILWLEPDWLFPYLRIAIAGNNTDADDTAEIDAYIIGVSY